MRGIIGKSIKAQDEELVKRLIDRLEHLSADSVYAHRASGLRGSLLRFQAFFETGKALSMDEEVQLGGVMEDGFEILELAAKELRAKK